MSGAEFSKIAMANLRATTVADLERHGFVCCNPPDDFEDCLSGVYLFMTSPNDEVFIVSQDSAQNLHTDEIIDTKTGQSLSKKGLPYSRGFSLRNPQP